MSFIRNWLGAFLGILLITTLVAEQSVALTTPDLDDENISQQQEEETNSKKEVNSLWDNTPEEGGEGGDEDTRLFDCHSTSTSTLSSAELLVYTPCYISKIHTKEAKAAICIPHRAFYLLYHNFKFHLPFSYA